MSSPAVDLRGAAKRNAERDKCVNGHPLSGNNVRVNAKGHRKCRTCQREWVRKQREQAAGTERPDILDAMDVRAKVRFWSRVEEREGCWIWTGPKLRGYGRFTLTRSPFNWAAQAHRLSYRMLVGPIPDGLELDHLCRRTSCVLPSHLEPVTRLVNQRRANAARLVDHASEGNPT